MHRTLLLTASFFLLASYAFAQQTRFVDDTGIDASDCTDAENPCTTIGFAIDQTESGDIIDIAAGTYTEAITLDKDLTLQGAGRDETIVQAHEEPGQANERVITLSGNQETEIAGVTIRHGKAFGASGPEGFGGGLYNDGGTLTLSDVAFENNEAGLSGGGLFNTNSSPTLTDVTFVGNVANGGCGTPACGGGGMVNTSESSPVLTNVVFSENSSNGNPGSFGGGMLNMTNSSPHLRNVTFSGNTADGVTGGLGGGMFNQEGSSPTLLEVVFNENTADHGGGMFNNTGSSPMLVNVSFDGNTANGDPSGFGGGMVNNINSSSSLTNVVFTGNVASVGGGLWNNNGSASTLANVVISNNAAETFGGGVFNNDDSAITLTNTIIWENFASAGFEIYNSGNVELHYSLYRDVAGAIDGGGGFEAENSLTEDPLFVDSADGDLRLMEGSPAIDAGDPDTDFALFPVNDDGDPIDLDGNPRVFGEAIDMGAYERNPNVAGEIPLEESANVLTLPHPNPVHNKATLALTVEREQDVTVELFNILGRRVQTLYNGALATGVTETLSLEASTLPAGVYVIRVTGEDFVETQRVTVVR